MSPLLSNGMAYSNIFHASMVKANIACGSTSTNITTIDTRATFSRRRFLRLIGLSFLRMVNNYIYKQLGSLEEKCLVVVHCISLMIATTFSIDLHLESSSIHIELQDFAHGLIFY